MKIGVIGSGKRFYNIYKKILDSLDSEVFIWNRTRSKIEKLASENENYKIIESISDFKNTELDICLSFLPPDVSFDILGSFNFNFPLLLETPIIDHRWAQKENIGALEQWIYLPTEQFKDLVYESGIISRPHWVFNDGRSFEYHAISQLRKYCSGAEPRKVSGLVQNLQNYKGFIDKNGNLNKDIESWKHGEVVLSGGEILTYIFTYNCKLTNLKPFQLLRAHSIDGSIVSGRSYEMDNDYEMFEVRYVNSENHVCIEKVKIESDGTTTSKLSLEKEGIVWENKFSNLGFNDQETAIAYLIEDSVENFYPASASFIDYITSMAISQSAYQEKIISFQNNREG